MNRFFLKILMPLCVTCFFTVGIAQTITDDHKQVFKSTRKISKKDHKKNIEQTRIETILKEAANELAKHEEFKQFLARNGLAIPLAGGVMSPTAFGVGWGSVYATGSWVNRWSHTDKEDAIAGIGMGFGNPYKSVGLSTTVNIGSVDMRDNGFAEDGGVALQLSRFLTPNFAAAVGVANVLGWGAYQNASHSFYTVLSQILGLSIFERKIPLSISVGAGTGAFVHNPNREKYFDSHIGPFIGLGIQLFPQFGVATDWVAKRFNVGFNVQPIKKLPLIVNAGIYNLNDEPKKTNAHHFYGVTIAYGWDFTT